MILGEPGLMNKAAVRIAERRYRRGCAFETHVCNFNAILGRAETDFLACVIRIRTRVTDALRIVRIERRVATGKNRVEWRSDVDHVQALRTGIGPDGIGKSRVFVDCEVVRVAEIAVGHVGRKGLRRRYAAQPGQIEHLHSVRSCAIGNDVGVVHVHLDVTPYRRAGGGRQAPEDDGILRVGDVNECSAVVHAHEGVLVARRAVCPAPDIVTGHTSHVAQRHALFQADAAACVTAGHSTDTSHGPICGIGQGILLGKVTVAAATAAGNHAYRQTGDTQNIPCANYDSLPHP